CHLPLPVDSFNSYRISADAKFSSQVQHRCSPYCTRLPFIYTREPPHAYFRKQPRGPIEDDGIQRGADYCSCGFCLHNANTLRIRCIYVPDLGVRFALCEFRSIRSGSSPDERPRVAENYTESYSGLAPGSVWNEEPYRIDHIVSQSAS